MHPVKFRSNAKQLSKSDDVIVDTYNKYYAALKSQVVIAGLSFEERLYTAHEIVEGVKRHNMYFYRRTNEDFKMHCEGKSAVAINAQPVNLASNDYLGFTKHPVIIAAATNTIEQYGAASGSVPLLAGTTGLHKKFESELASFLDYEKAITYNSGYAANYGLLTALLTSSDVAILDMSVHASIIDGCCNTNKIYFSHNDPASLKIALMKATGYQNKLVIIDGVYSMDGDIATLDEIMAITKEEHAWLMVDESHATGVIGEQGSGTHSHFGLNEKAEILTGSLGKALGGSGGYVAGSAEMINFLEITSRPFIFSTSIPQHSAAQLTAALHLLKAGDGALGRLWSNIDYFKSGMDKIGFEPDQSASAIIPLVIRDEVKLLNFCSFLHHNNVFVNPIFYPVVSKKKSRIRISVTALLKEDELSYALDRIEIAANKFYII